MAELQLKYYFDWEASGKLTKITSTETNQIVAMDGSDQEFYTALTWLSAQVEGVRQKRIPENVEYLGTREAVFEWFSSRGLTMCVQCTTARLDCHLKTHSGERLDVIHAIDSKYHDQQFWSITKTIPAVEVGPHYPLPELVDGADTPIRVPLEVIEAINKELQDTRSEACKFTSKAVERTFVLFDISDFSQLPSRQQALAISKICSIAGELRL